MQDQLSELKSLVESTKQELADSKKQSPEKELGKIAELEEKLNQNTEQLVRKMLEESLPKKTPLDVVDANIVETSAPYVDSRDRPQDMPHGVEQPRINAQSKVATRSRFGKVVVALQSAKNFIKAGDTVQAKLLGGVVVSTGTKNAENPKPVVMEIIDSSNLPEWFSRNEKKCRVIGSCFGSISDERIYIRLETLSCSSRDGFDIWEQQIDGWVAGEDGRAGVRGTVVIKDRELMMNSLLGGVLGGAASTIGQMAGGTSSFNPMTGDVNKNQKISSLLQQSGGAGISGALDRYAKYYIERAEMLEPVIQVSSNRTVDIIFKRGAYLQKVQPQDLDDTSEPRQPLNSQAKGVSKSEFDEAETFINGLYEEKDDD